MTPEGRSYIVAAPTAGHARYEARRKAQQERHPNPDHGSILWVEEVRPGQWEVVIGTAGRYM